jgi:hypothetical protein
MEMKRLKWSSGDEMDCGKRGCVVKGLKLKIEI